MDCEESKVKELLTCSICLDVFKDPKTLSCEHSFCRKCLEKTFRKNGNKLMCPTCRYNVEEIALHTDIELLRTSLHLKQTMEIFAKENLYDERKFSWEEDDYDDDDYDEEKRVVQAISDLDVDDDKDLCKKTQVKKTADNSTRLEIKKANDIDNCDIVDNNDDEDLNKKGEASCNNTDLSDGINNYDSSDEIKKENDVSDLETDSEFDEEIERERIQRLIRKEKKKKSLFGKFSKKIFGYRQHDQVLEDFWNQSSPPPSYNSWNSPPPNYESVVQSSSYQDKIDGSSPCRQKSRETSVYNEMSNNQDCNKVPKSKTTAELFCSFCNKLDHDLEHCAKASMAARHHKRKQYAKTAALVGSGYLASTRPTSSSLLMNKHTPGVVGYNASQGMSRGRGSGSSSTTSPMRKVQKKNKKESRMGKARGRGSGRGKGRGKGRGLVIVL